MSDIVERLRRPVFDSEEWYSALGAAFKMRDAGHRDSCARDLMDSYVDEAATERTEAADEIERLRAEVALWHQLWDNVALDVPDLRADNKPLAVAASYELLKREVARLTAEQDAVSVAIGTNEYMDPPDGGNVSLAEQVRRMRADILALREQIAALESREVCTVAHDNVGTCGYCQRDALLAEVARLTDVLRRGGFVECDIPACNCGGWHHRYGLPERWAEITQALIDADVLGNSTGNKPLNAIKRLADERDALLARVEAAERERGTAALRVAFGEELWQLGHPAYVVVHLRDEIEKVTRLWKASTVENAALLARVEAAERDAARYRWLTSDHNDSWVRQHCREILERMGVMSYSATSTAIDAAMEGGK